MGIFDIFSNFNKFKKEPKDSRGIGSIGSITNSAQLAEALELIGESIGYADYRKNFNEGYLVNPYVNACITKKTTAAKQPSWELWDNKKQIIKKPVATSPLLPLWNLLFESHFYTGSTWDNITEQSILYNDLAGEYFIHIPDIAATLRGNGYLVYLEPDEVSIEYNRYIINKGKSNEKTIPKITTVNGKQIPTILHKQNWNKGQPRGLSRLAPAWASVKITNTGSEWNYNLLKNGCRPSMIMMFDTSGLEMSAEQFERIKQSAQDFSGSSNAGKLLVVQAGPSTQIAELGLTTKDMDFLNLEEISAKRIALALGVPPVLLGFKSDSTYSNVGEANKALYTQTIMPELEEFRSSIEAWFRVIWGDNISIKLNYDDVDAVALIKKQKTDEAVMLFEKGLITQNEARLLIGYEELKEETQPPTQNNQTDNSETINKTINNEEQSTDINDEEATSE